MKNNIIAQLKHAVREKKKGLDDEYEKGKSRLCRLKSKLIKEHKLSTGYQAYNHFEHQIDNRNRNDNYLGPYNCPVCRGKGTLIVFSEKRILEGFEDKKECWSCGGRGKLYFCHGYNDAESGGPSR